MKKVRDGDVDALGTLFERHHRRLFGFFLRWAGDRQVAEDLVQEVFFRMLKYRHTYRDDGDFKVWSLSLARNVTNDRWRRAGRVAEHETVVDETPDVAASAPLAFDRMATEERNTLLRRALAELPDDKRELIELARFQNLPYTQIAELLDTTVGAVKVRVHRAVKQLGDTARRMAPELAT